jgi:hypothetical protein
MTAHGIFPLGDLDLQGRRVERIRPLQLDPNEKSMIVIRHLCLQMDNISSLTCLIGTIKKTPLDRTLNSTNKPTKPDVVTDVDTAVAETDSLPLFLRINSLPRFSPRHHFQGIMVVILQCHPVTSPMDARNLYHIIHQIRHLAIPNNHTLQ